MWNSRNARLRLKAGAISMLLVAVCRAELSPAVYKQMQKSVGEFLEIEVLSVKTTEGLEEVVVNIEATVTRVTRSKSGLKVGDLIRIKYARRTKLVAGPSPAPLLEKNKKYPAFLSRTSDKDYEPAAGGKSFEIVQ